ncbi:MAG: anthranilate phosphoribosyltransferase [Gammaproteobacteria bacterium]
MSVAPRDLLDKLLDGIDLTRLEAETLLGCLTDGECPPAMAGALLAALRAKGETPDEILGLASAMRNIARRPTFDSDVGLTDVVGTGGDGSGSLNISTGTALLAAACGVPIVKHGNRSISSRSGSADALESLGLQMPLDESAAAACLQMTGFTFLFAPYYHPAMKHLAPVRSALGVRTVFNILGPLTNPASPGFNLIGAYSPDMAALMAQALAGAGIERAFVVHGEPGWDEATPVGPFLLFDVGPGSVTKTTRDPAEWGLARCRAEDLRGGDAEHNASRLRAVLCGEEHGPHRDALMLGAALVLELTGRCETPTEGIAAAAAALDSGRGAELLQAIADAGRELGAV